MAKGGLGSGLGSLFEQNAADPASGVQSVRISEIEQNRSQPRKRRLWLRHKLLPIPGLRWKRSLLLRQNPLKKSLNLLLLRIPL